MCLAHSPAVRTPLYTDSQSSSVPASTHGLPLARRLAQAVRHDLENLSVPAQSAVTAFDFDVLDMLRSALLHAILPRHDAIAAAENRGGGHAGRGRKLPGQRFGERRFFAVEQPVNPLGMGMGVIGRVSKRCADGDYLTRALAVAWPLRVHRCRHSHLRRRERGARLPPDRRRQSWP